MKNMVKIFATAMSVMMLGGAVFASPVLAEGAEIAPSEIVVETVDAGNASTGTGVDGFVERLYKVCLDRTPDAAGKADWADKLTRYQISGSKAAYGFVFSPEFQSKNFSNEDFVEHLYAAFMGRGSDAGGKAGWVDKLNSGASREEVFNGFANSVEFDKICNSYGIVSKDIETFVTRLYAVCLDRLPDAGGLADWSNQLRSGSASGGDVAYGFIWSPEFQNKSNCNKHWVQYMYKAFFGREPDEGGWSTWIYQLDTLSTKGQVFDGFVYSNEFKQLCAEYGINVGNGDHSRLAYGQNGGCKVEGCGVSSPIITPPPAPTPRPINPHTPEITNPEVGPGIDGELGGDDTDWTKDHSCGNSGNGQLFD